MRKFLVALLIVLILIWGSWKILPAHIKLYISKYLMMPYKTITTKSEEKKAKQQPPSAGEIVIEGKDGKKTIQIPK